MVLRGRIPLLATLMVVLVATAFFTGDAQAQAEPTLTISKEFRVGSPIPIDATVGALRVVDLTVVRDERRLIDQVLPPRGGQSRFSWLDYRVVAENPASNSLNLAVTLRLLDENGAIIDEFEMRERVWRGRTEELSLRRLTLNYVLPLIDRVELDFRVYD
jgi:hypothetical protein